MNQVNSHNEDSIDTYVEKITTVALSLLDKIFFTCSADLNSFSSIKGFSNPGEEYIEIDSENKILTRRVTKFPKLNKPKFLIGLTFISVLFAIFSSLIL